MEEQVAVRPLTSDCAAALAAREHVCVGVSPFNGYFTPGRIAWLADWALRCFDSAHFFVPDLPAAHTLEALGYPPERAAHKARRQGTYVKNKIGRALAGLGVTDPEPYILDSHALQANPAYGKGLAAAQELYEREARFRTACLQASRWVLNAREPIDGQPVDHQRLQRAVRYFLAELPLFTDTVGIVNRQASVFCYHQSPPFLERLYRRELPCEPTPGQGFVTVNARTAGQPSPTN